MHRGNVTISRTNHDEICIVIKSNDSGVNSFVEARLTPEQYGMLVTGLGNVHCDLDFRNLDVFGKKKITEKREVIAPDMGYDRNLYANWLTENCQEEGWIINSSLNSHSSVSHCDTGVRLVYSVYRFED